MAGPTEFSLEAVRQYMLARDGQVKHIQFLFILEIFTTMKEPPNSTSKTNTSVILIGY